MNPMKKLVKGLSEHHVSFEVKLRCLTEMRQHGFITVQEHQMLKKWTWLNEGLYN